MAYTEKHKQFLQYFMFNRMVLEEDVKNINANLFPGKQLDDTVELINTKILPLEFKISKTICEQNGSINYTFIALFVDEFNCKVDPIKKLFADIVNFIISSGGCAPYNEMIENYKNFNSFDNSLDVLFEKKYLTADPEKNIYLTPLAISELEGFLVEKYISRRCMGCMSIVVYGIQCSSCNDFIHGHCLTSYSLSVGSQKCPKCYHKISVSWIPLNVGQSL
ncbi:non-structural maintenance of chromosomes element 1 homolog [Daktulosphaira vitifoliae]|uniref:non-structural maintenance of chromosomes element 1 homolog n=1 Tax=Daktulosphaira vitifoliae TaxID=58002 RepID=UPI0021A9DAB0|nr:non-structural maintenance of chromosomes element 1 homolog [Daktulosphaira vitifoliae]XP_050534927.1 non-structural maintenance of chromosomes element 1 homolog [Daktulosphaira vitifoliae]